MTAPESVHIRTYQVGFGDCFLVSFRYASDEERHVLIDFGSTSLPADAPRSRMDDVAANIRERSGGALTAVVATHRHKDHVSGFAPDRRGGGSGAVIAGLAPKLVVQPWTEDPKLAPDATAPAQGAGRALKGAHRRVASLAAMQQVAGQLLAEAKRRRDLPAGVRDELGFLGEDNLGNAGAVKNLMTMGRNEYVHAGQASRLGRLLPGVEVHVLGPPTVEQTDTILNQRRKDPDEFWHLQAAAGRSLEAAGSGTMRPLFPDHVHCTAADGFPIDCRWLIYHARRLRGEQMLRIVRMLDKAMNNTSLILLFRVGAKSLLFPGDAQIENWAYALSRTEIRRMLAQVDLYKVGHHGSLNATPKTLWSLLERRSRDARARDRLIALLSTMAGQHGSVERRTEVPRRTLVAELERESNLFSTEALSGERFYHDTVLRV
jgi:hypothetical protein